MQGRESIQPRKMIGKPWRVEVDFLEHEGLVLVNLVNEDTGEIRQKRISPDTLARKVFADEIKTWNLDDYLWRHIPIVDRVKS